MRVDYLLALALPLGSTLAATTPKKSTTTTSSTTKKSTTSTTPSTTPKSTPKTTTSTSTTPVSTAKATLCSVLGKINSAIGPFSTITGSPSVTPAQCQLFCQQTTGCLSYAVSGGKCYLFKNNVASEYVSATTGIVYSFYDSACSVTTTTSSTSTSTAKTTPTTPTTPHTNAAATQVAETFQAVTSPVVPTADSPSLTSSSVVFPTDPSWTATYSYEDDPMPTVVAMGSAPNTNGLPAPSPTQALSCVVDPASGAAFTLANPSFWPIVSKTGSFVGSLPTPTSQAQASALGFPGPLQVPQYSFKAASGAPAGVYDLVLGGSTPLYVAKSSSGLVILTTSSTGPYAATRNGVSMVTSIFSVDCFGRILVSQGGTNYTWAVSGDYTQMTAGTPTSYFYAIPSAPPSSTSTPSSRVRRHEKRAARKRAATDGAAPRCPNLPTGLTSNLKPSAPALNEQGCLWLETGLYSVVAYNFDDDCNALDECYGNCASETWEQCNNDFVQDVSAWTCDTMAISTDWTDWVSSAGCTAQLVHWRSVIGGSKGRDRFESVNSQQCSCYCPGSASMCTDSSNNPTCVSLFSNDAGNCGACGRTCSAKGVCKSGTCSCPHDQCNSRCVNLLTSATNCGACGNVCSSGACWQGQCYNPPPNACVPGQGDGFTNGNFASGLTNWSMSAAGSSANSQWSTSSDGLVLKVQTPDSDVYGVNFAQNFPICPNVTYELYFQLKHVAGSANCFTSWSFPSGGDYKLVTVPSGTNSDFVSYGPYPFGPYDDPDPSAELMEFGGVILCRAQGDNNMEVHIKGVEFDAVPSS